MADKHQGHDISVTQVYGPDGCKESEIYCDTCQETIK